MIKKKMTTDSRSPASPSRILIVEENRDAAVTLGMLCEQMGHECAFAYDGAVAVDIARQFHPDVVLLDIGLPGMDGFEVARHLRLDPSMRDTLIIAITGLAREEHRKLALEVGIDHYLVKPADPRFLESLLRRRPQL